MCYACRSLATGAKSFEMTILNICGLTREKSGGRRASAKICDARRCFRRHGARRRNENGEQDEGGQFYAKEDVRVRTVAAPTVIGDSEVMVRPLTCGICGTDLHEFASSHHGAQSPHKFTGAMLPNFSAMNSPPKFSMSGAPSRGCARAIASRSSRSSCRSTITTAARGLNHLSPSMGCVGLSWAWGGMGEFAVVNDYNANIIPDNVTDEQGALVEPTAVALYSVDRAKVTGGSAVHITGAGPIGALVALICDAVGASKIFVSEPNANRRRHIESSGVAAAVLDPKAVNVVNISARTPRKASASMPPSMLWDRGGPQRLRRGGPQPWDGGSDRPARQEGSRGSGALGAERHHDRGDLVLPGDDVAARHPDDCERAAPGGEDHHRPDRARSHRRERLPLAAGREPGGDEGDGQDDLKAV